MTEFKDEIHPDNGNIIFANPADLMRDNPAALIVNRESYARMKAHFSYGSNGQFEPPQVVKVSTFSSEHGEVLRVFVLDGLTRTKFVYDNQNNPGIIPPDFKFHVRDVTESALLNSTIVLPEEGINNQRALSMLQYLRAVIPPTIQHAQIAPDRVAAHLINGWDNMVGEELSRKYSALAALSLLANPGLNIATDNDLKKDLVNETRVIVDETDRQRLQEKLIEIAAVIRQTRLNRQQIARSAYVLVATESPVIGGERETIRQVYNLVHAPEVNKKLQEAFPDIGSQDQMRHQLANVILESFKRVGKASNREEIIEVMGKTLRDPSLDFDHVIDVFTSPDPIVRYDQVREAINKDRLTEAYMALHKLQSLNAEEGQLIETLGKKTILQDSDIPVLVKAIRSANNTLRLADESRKQLSARRDELITLGVTPQLIDEALTRIEAAQAGVTTATTLGLVSKKNQELADTLNETQGKINTQATMHRIGGIVDQITGDKLEEGYGPQVRKDIVNFIFGEFGVFQESSLPQVTQRIREIASLDHNLLLKVKNGDLRLAAALRRQEEKTKPVRSALPAEPISGLIETPPISFSVTARVDAIPPSDEDVIMIDRQTLEERRRRNNREKLNKIMDAVNKGLADIDLSPEDLTVKERDRIHETIRRLGLLVFNHPDTPTVMLELYPNLRKKVVQLQEELVNLQRELSDRDARTQR